MRKILFTLVICCGLSANTFAKEWKTIRFMVEGAYPPFNWTTEDGHLAGFDVDLANALCEELKAKCVIRKQDWDGIIPALLARKSDAIIAAMTITPSREEKVAFTNPYARVPQRFVMTNDREIDTSMIGMNKLVVGVQRATIGDEYLSQAFPDIQIRRYNTFDEAFTDLLNGRLDTVFGGAIGLRSGFLDTEEGKNFHFTGPSYTDPKWFGKGIGIAVRKQDDDLKVQLNQALERLVANGTHKSIADKYFSYDIYNAGTM
ncbi:transporter substrate-binding domain-containing protein [Vibrio fluvialis]|uniref:transporter substrate-binding domain-containing protein n=1 Tax=Vibrio fluvialis TaxID=676 RepID=UPI001C9D2A7E|nr:transporter substrate-binding domain-containing protein [Vibrio fluvialis]EKO3377814.1 transporter substrate-binding domain-containing protein [Vibrio fluvialis]EKO3430889.1 transporter substrate-binding domain-containing protein [Vibrio fluvialis]EKO3481964.1 transporter substrate-binding domain-containing protein [Vibrio fluvialis]EKO3917793.1 transporter substrate-binding domain-containing protein [Vibrio fluvialis]EKO3967211.1 transporter substrate-binding domain-containing protein [Vib